MGQFQEIKAKALQENPFKLIGEDWALITAKKEDKVNTMTASWGGLGIMWGKEVAFIVIRPQRYTKEFVDKATEFSLTFFAPEYKKVLTYLGTVSGREEEKLQKARLTVLEEEGVPYFAEAQLAILCKKLYEQPLAKDSFLEESLIKDWYPAEDFHILYIGEIEKILLKK